MQLDATDQRTVDHSPLSWNEYNKLIDKCVKLMVNQGQSEYEARRALAGEPPCVLNALLL